MERFILRDTSSFDMRSTKPANGSSLLLQPRKIETLVLTGRVLFLVSCILSDARLDSMLLRRVSCSVGFETVSPVFG